MRKVILSAATVIGGIIIAAAGVSPEDATSNLAAWIKWLGFGAAPKWLASKSVDAYAMSIGTALVVLSIGLAIFFWLRQRSNLRAASKARTWMINCLSDNTSNTNESVGFLASDGGSLMVDDSISRGHRVGFESRGRGSKLFGKRNVAQSRIAAIDDPGRPVLPDIEISKQLDQVTSELTALDGQLIKAFCADDGRYERTLRKLNKGFAGGLCRKARELERELLARLKDSGKSLLLDAEGGELQAHGRLVLREGRAIGPLPFERLAGYLNTLAKASGLVSSEASSSNGNR